MNNLPQTIDYNEDEIKLIKQQIAPGTTDSELKLFLYQCKRTGLDPLVRQIYAIRRGDKMTIQTSIDGFRVIAERSKKYAGQDEPEFAYNPDGSLLSCKVRVYRWRLGQRYQASVGVAFWNEYVQAYNGKPSGLWAKMPHTMLSKVAEALALRKAFPQDLSGIYTADEMNQADLTVSGSPQVTVSSSQEIETQEVVEHPATARQKQQILILINNPVFSEEEKAKTVSQLNGITSEKAEKFIASFSKLIAKRSSPSNKLITLLQSPGLETERELFDETYPDLAAIEAIPAAEVEKMINELNEKLKTLQHA